MNLEQLLSEPQLVEIKLTKPEIVEKHGEVVFYLYDRQDMETYMQLSKLSGDGGFSEIEKVTKSLVRNKKGELLLSGNKQLPPDVMMAVIEESITQLGNMIAQTSENQAEK
tara:strand:- start:2723 stop:3055 length:333 start_codon:yes stop_codon:yes gene_type:complete